MKKKLFILFSPATAEFETVFPEYNDDFAYSKNLTSRVTLKHYGYLFFETMNKRNSSSYDMNTVQFVNLSNEKLKVLFSLAVKRSCTILNSF